ncbi:MAG: 2-amino-4-hydroxy-6-hydroxymethyldihydropteridine diphosphokinase [Alphaproteobacteria bacterium]
MGIVVALGSNLGDRMAALQSARQHLAQILDHLVAAPIYETAPCYVTDQPHFLNSVVIGKTSMPPGELLHALQTAEQLMGRAPTLRYGPRLIDLDIIYYDNVIMTERNLTIPHPLRLERRFVLQPLADIAPELIDPVTQQTIRTQLAQLPSDPTIIRHASIW